MIIFINSSKIQKILPPTLIFKIFFALFSLHLQMRLCIQTYKIELIQKI